MADRLTRFDAELVESAAAEGRRQQRSARQQLEHWAMVGRYVTSQRSMAPSRVEAALAGKLPLNDLSNEEGILYDAELDARVEESLARTDLSSELAAEGITTVALDDEGNLVERRPDGTTSIIVDQASSLS